MQDDGNYRAVDGSDFIISRVAFRDNTSKYYINNRGSNFTEVTKLLKGKGVDLDNNRFLILQVLCVLHMLLMNNAKQFNCSLEVTVRFGSVNYISTCVAYPFCLRL